MKIVFLDTSTLGSDISLDKFSEFGEVVTYEVTMPDQTLQRVQNAHIVVTNKVVIDKEIMEQSAIKLICIAATGMNNVDLEYAKETGVEVKNVAGYSTASVVQLTFAFALHFVQKIAFYDRYVKEKNWERSPIFTNLDMPFYELENKTWGIIGLGTIGKKVANIAEAFGCCVNYYSTSGTNYNTNYNSLSLEELLSTSDIISIHSLLNDTTYNMINKTNLKLIKQGGILLNLGRGGIINEQDLANEIDSRKIYCGLDVVSKEPIEVQNPLNLIQYKERIVITPHIAWASIESRNRLVDGIYNNIIQYIS